MSGYLGGETLLRGSQPGPRDGRLLAGDQWAIDHPDEVLAEKKAIHERLLRGIRAVRNGQKPLPGDLSAGMFTRRTILNAQDEWLRSLDSSD